MAIVGFSYSKFDCLKNAKKQVSGGIEIGHNISIDDVSKTKLGVGSSGDEVLNIDFTFSVNYGDDLGYVKISGSVVFSDTKDIIEETFKGWNSDKKLNSLVNEEVLRFIYGKVTIKAMGLADSLGLPPPIPMPKLNFSEKKN